MANILVLDDVLDAAILIKRILQKKGHQVFTFTEEEGGFKLFTVPYHRPGNFRY